MALNEKQILIINVVLEKLHGIYSDEVKPFIEKLKNFKDIITINETSIEVFENIIKPLRRINVTQEILFDLENILNQLIEANKMDEKLSKMEGRILEMENLKNETQKRIENLKSYLSNNN